MRPAAATPLPPAGAARAIALAACGCAVVAASLAVAPGASGWFAAALGLLALAVADVDARSFIIPDALNLALATLGLAAAATAPEAGSAIVSALARGGALFLVFYGVRAAYFRWRGREGLGLGDVKLAGVAGLWLDWSFAPFAVELAALAALLSCAILHFSGRRPFEGGARLPFGAFFAPAIWAVFLAQAAIGGP